MDKLSLRFENVSYAYPLSDKNAIEGMSLSIEKGEKIAVLGRNAMGKSTFFSLANGSLEADQGAIYLGGEKITRSKKSLNKLRKKIGLVFQDPESQFIAPSVEEEISFGPLNLGIGQDKTREIISSCLRTLNIDHLRERSVYSLSGGEKKLVSIASVLALDPEIVFFDEPTAGLDNYNEKILINSLKILEDKGLGLVISTHDMDFAWEFADRVILIRDGRLVADGTSQEILADEDLLRENQLDQPNLLRFAKMLGKFEQKGSYPKTYKDLEKLLNKNLD